MQNTHTGKTAYTFFCNLQLIYKENRTETTVFQNRTETKPEKSIPHIPSQQSIYGLNF